MSHWGDCRAEEMKDSDEEWDLRVLDSRLYRVGDPYRRKPVRGVK